MPRKLWKLSEADPHKREYRDALREARRFQTFMEGSQSNSTYREFLEKRNAVIRNISKFWSKAVSFEDSRII